MHRCSPFYNARNFFFGSSHSIIIICCMAKHKLLQFALLYGTIIKLPQAWTGTSSN